MTAATETTTTADPAAATTPDDPTEPIPVVPADDPVPADDAEPADAEGEPAKGKRKAAVRAAFTNWWGFVRQPMGVGEAWRASDVIDSRRIPGDSQLLAFLWYWSNRTDRIALFLCLAWLPTWANSPILWCAVRPTRRWGLYLVLFVLFVIVPRATGG